MSQPKAQIEKYWRWDVTIQSITKEKRLFPRRLILTGQWSRPGEVLYVVKTQAHLSGWADVFAWLGGGRRSEKDQFYARSAQDIRPALEKKYDSVSRKENLKEMIEIPE